MSDDRFKQARRSLIDRHNQRQQQGGWDDSFDGDDFEDEATALVNLDGQPAFAPPPNFSGEDEPVDTGVPTEMFQIDQGGGGLPPSGVQMRSHSGVQPSYDSFGGPGGQHAQVPQQQPPQQQPARQQQVFAPPAHGQHDAGYNSGSLRDADPNQSLVIGHTADVDFEQNTAFINLNDFAQGGESFTPDSTAAGYEGSTQFVNIAALQASGPPGATPVEHDAILKQTYQFGPESIQQGEFTLIFAQNQAGRPVVLKRIWEGDPNGMPMPVRQRIAALDQIRHPALVALNGMVAAPSGAWVELSRPPGYRLTDVINNNGPQDPAQVERWVTQVSEILTVIHGHAFVFANLTTDAVWIQDDGSVMLEPFDVLAYELRGNLGVFGPPELNFPPEQQQLSPATDVYSLAAVTVAALTGLPLNLATVETLPKNTKTAVIAALNQDPAQRPADAVAYVATLQGKRRAGSAGGNKMKILIPAVAVLGTVLLVAVYFLRPAPTLVVSDQTNNANGTAGPAPEGTTGSVEGPAPSADVTNDPRLTIRNSLTNNPPKDDDSKPSAADMDLAADYRAEARELITDIDNLAPDSKRSRYAQAMQKLARAVRTSGTMTVADKDLFEELSASNFVDEIRSNFYDRLDQSLKAERIGSVKQVYPQLAAVDAEASEMRFFENNRSVNIVTVEPIELEE